MSSQTALSSIRTLKVPANQKPETKTNAENELNKALSQHDPNHEDSEKKQVTAGDSGARSSESGSQHNTADTQCKHAQTRTVPSDHGEASTAQAL